MITGKRILFCAERDKVLKEYFPLIIALQDKGAVPVVLASAGATQKWLGPLKDKGIAVTLFEEHAGQVPAAKAAGTAASVGAANARPVRQALLNSAAGREARQLFHFFRTFKEYRRLARIFKKIFQSTRPDLIILPGEGNLRRMVPLKLAQARRIPSLALPIIYGTNTTTAEYFSSYPDLKDLQTGKSLINRIVIKAFPQWAYQKEGLCVLRDPGGEMLATFLLGLLPKNPWTIGTGLASRVAVENRYEHRLMMECGVPKDKAVITGKPRMDIVFEQLQVDVGKARERLGVPKNHKIVLCSLPHYAEHGMLSWEDQWKECGFLLETFDKLPDVTTLITLYPDSDEQKYRAFIGKFKAILPEVHDVFTLMALCDVYVVDTSCSTLPLALAAGKPAVTFNFMNDGLRPSYDIPTGALQVFDRSRLLAAIQGFLSDAGERRKWLESQNKAARELCTMDGKCTQRVIEQIEDLLHAP